MDIDISVLRLMEREKDVPFETLASASSSTIGRRRLRSFGRGCVVVECGT